MIDILNLLGYSFTSSISDGKNGTMRNETVKEIYKNGKLICSRSEILEIGNKINICLCNSLEFKTEFVLRMNDLRMQEFLTELQEEK